MLGILRGLVEFNFFSAVKSEGLGHSDLFLVHVDFAPLRLSSTCPEALPQMDRTLANRSLGFRKLSRKACSLHALVRVPMDNHPYRLFKLLEIRSDPVPPDMGPACLFDEVAHTFFATYPATEEGELSAEAFAFLESSARAIDVDLATIEAKHASTRRIAQLRGTQTWVPSLETVNTEWVCRQVSINEQSAASEHYRQQKDGKTKKKRKTPGKQKGAKGGGGGGCRAFFHEKHQGRKMTAASIKEMHAAYDALPPEEKQRYKEIGRNATLAWRQGYKSFADAPARKMFPSEFQEQTLSLVDAVEPIPIDIQGNYVRSDGVIVGMPVDEGRVAETLIPYRSRNFAADIKKIRSHVYKMASRARQASQDRAFVYVHDVLSMCIKE